MVVLSSIHPCYPSVHYAPPWLTKEDPFWSGLLRDDPSHRIHPISKDGPKLTPSSGVTTLYKMVKAPFENHLDSIATTYVCVPTDVVFEAAMYCIMCLPQ